MPKARVVIRGSRLVKRRSIAPKRMIEELASRRERPGLVADMPENRRRDIRICAEPVAVRSGLWDGEPVVRPHRVDERVVIGGVRAAFPEARRPGLDDAKRR